MIMEEYKTKKENLMVKISIIAVLSVISMSFTTYDNVLTIFFLSILGLCIFFNLILSFLGDYIISFLHKLKIKRTDDIFLQVFFTDFSSNKRVIDYCYNRVIELSKTKFDIPIYFINFEEDSNACGRFLYYCEDNKGFEDGLPVPRIEVDKEQDKLTQMFIILRQLGRSLMNRYGEPQIDDLADKYAVKIFQENFDKMFWLIFHIHLNVYNEKFEIDDYRKWYLNYYLNNPHRKVLNLKLYDK